VDDLADWREVLGDTLRKGGFYVDTVATVAEALQHLEETFYHLLVLDVRMENQNPDNIDGLTLLDEIKQRGLNQATKVIMLSAYGTPEQMRVTFKDYEVLDFVPKDNFNNLHFLENVQQIFATKVKNNLNLDTLWQQGSTPEQAILNMKVAGTHVKPGSPLFQRIIAELDELLCSLFCEAESILVQPLVPGLSGTRVLQVRPFFPDGAGQSVVVKFGNAYRIEEEHNNFWRYVQPYIGGRRCTTIRNVRRTPYLGGIVYTLIGMANDQLENFGSFYRQATVTQIARVIDDLFLNTCSPWYANPGVLHAHNLTADYQQLFGYTPELLELAIASILGSAQKMDTLTFKSLTDTRSFTNPMHTVTESPIILPTYLCTTHGDFNQNNILVDSDEHVWLIDFQGTGRGHILRDVAMLDSTIRFQLLKENEATLEECLMMEEMLNSITRFSHLPQLTNRLLTQNPALLKAYDTIVHLRRIAYKLIAQNPYDNINEYYAALLYNALNALHSSSLSQGQREHALLCACLLAERSELVR
jgi:CheY-like chemotaxis protein